MAIFYASLKVLTRSRGDSAIAAAAYRAGKNFADQRTGATHRYATKRGVEHVALLLPPGSPSWAHDIEQLWNHAEAAEHRKNSSVARELIIALPPELPEARRLLLATAVAQALVDRYRVALLMAVHAPDAGGDQRNHHAHLLFSTRALGPTGFGAKVRVLDDQRKGRDEVKWLRAMVADLTNGALEEQGVNERVDHRTLVAQAAEAEGLSDFDRAAALTREPTRHQGRAATAAARRGDWSFAVANNVARQAKHAEDLHAYLGRAHAQGRLMAPSSDARPRRAAPDFRTSKFERLVRPVLAPYLGMWSTNAFLLDADEAGTKLGRAYLRGLRRSAKEGQRWLDSFVALGRHQQALAQWLARNEERATLDALRRASRTLAEIRRSRQQHRAQWRKWEEVSASRRLEQVELDHHESQGKPKSWHLLRQAQWQKERQQRWGRLRRAMAAEQDAHQDSAACKAHAEALTTRLRNELREFEARLDASVERAATGSHAARRNSGMAPVGTVRDVHRPRLQP